MTRSSCKNICESLSQIFDSPLEIIWHDNQRSYLSVKKIRGKIILRLHTLFLDAPTPVLEAIHQFILKKKPEARKILRQMAHLHFSKGEGKSTNLQPQGKVYDLQRIFDPYREEFHLKNIRIGWSRGKKKTSFRSITFGTFDAHRNEIKIHPILDSDEVPLYFLEFIVYHEMLHALFPSKWEGDRQCTIHSKEFREMEKKFPKYREAKEWEKSSLKFFKSRRLHGRTQ